MPYTTSLDCTKYYLCIDGAYVGFRCKRVYLEANDKFDTQLYFDTLTLTCVEKHLVQCYQATTLEPITVPTTGQTTDSGDVCYSWAITGVPGDCQTFKECRPKYVAASSGVWVTEKCRDPLRFDIVSQTCTRPEAANCFGKAIEQTSLSRHFFDRENYFLRVSSRGKARAG